MWIYKEAAGHLSQWSKGPIHSAGFLTKMSCFEILSSAEPGLFLYLWFFLTAGRNRLSGSWRVHDLGGGRSDCCIVKWVSGWGRQVTSKLHMEIPKHYCSGDTECPNHCIEGAWKDWGAFLSEQSLVPNHWISSFFRKEWFLLIICFLLLANKTNSLSSLAMFFFFFLFTCYVFLYLCGSHH